MASKHLLFRKFFEVRLLIKLPKQLTEEIPRREVLLKVSYSLHHHKDIASVINIVSRLTLERPTSSLSH